MCPKVREQGLAIMLAIILFSDIQLRIVGPVKLTPRLLQWPIAKCERLGEHVTGVCYVTLTSVSNLSFKQVYLFQQLRIRIYLLWVIQVTNKTVKCNYHMLYNQIELYGLVIKFLVITNYPKKYPNLLFYNSKPVKNKAGLQESMCALQSP